MGRARHFSVRQLGPSTGHGLRLVGHSAPVLCVKHVSTSNQLVSSSADSTLCFWGAVGNDKEGRVHDHTHSGVNGGRGGDSTTGFALDRRIPTPEVITALEVVFITTTTTNQSESDSDDDTVTSHRRRVGGGMSGYKKPSSATRMAPGDNSAGPTHDAKHPQTLPPSYTLRQAKKRARLPQGGSNSPVAGSSGIRGDGDMGLSGDGGVGADGADGADGVGVVDRVETALFLGGASGAIYAYNLSTDQMVKLDGGGHRGPCESLCAIPSMHLVASGGGGQDSNIIVW